MIITQWCITTSSSQLKPQGIIILTDMKKGADTVRGYYGGLRKEVWCLLQMWLLFTQISCRKLKNYGGVTYMITSQLAIFNHKWCLNFPICRIMRYPKTLTAEGSYLLAQCSLTVGPDIISPQKISPPSTPPYRPPPHPKTCTYSTKQTNQRAITKSVNNKHNDNHKSKL